MSLFTLQDSKHGHLLPWGAQTGVEGSSGAAGNPVNPQVMKLNEAHNNSKHTKKGNF